MRVYCFPTCEVYVAQGRAITVFRGGLTHEMCPPVHDPVYCDIARKFGYDGDATRYGIEHDLVHHATAAMMGWPWSYSLHSAAMSPNLRRSGAVWSQRVSDEEHLVNALQRFVWTGQLDEHQALTGIFGDKLKHVAKLLTKLLTCIDHRVTFTCSPKSCRVEYPPQSRPHAFEWELS